jgi:hypothetical protein
LDSGVTTWRLKLFIAIFFITISRLFTISHLITDFETRGLPALAVGHMEFDGLPGWVDLGAVRATKEAEFGEVSLVVEYRVMLCP